MNKHISTTGPTGLSRIRSLVTFRHQNRAARLVSTLAAAAMATLLVAGTGAAYADDSAPSDPAATEATAPATETTDAPADPPADTASDAPAADSAATPSDSGAGDTSSQTAATDSTAGSSTSDSASGQLAAGATSAPMSTTLAKLANADAALLPGTTVVVPCDYQSPDWAIVSGFEIDGNLCLAGDPTNGSEDWDSLAYTGPTTGDEVLDELGDSSGFTEGSAETSDPVAWVGGHVPNAKNDIESAWGYSKAAGGHVYAYFGFTSSSQSGGTQEVNMEYNQKDPQPNATNDLAVPDRTAGDLLFHFGMNGSAPLSFDTVLVWTPESDDAWIPPSNDPTSCTEVSGYSPAAGWCPVTGIPASAFHSAVSADGQFAEGSIDISLLPIFVGGCSGEFGTMQMRTTTGNAWTSAMKDYVGPLAVNTPSTCGKLVITKTDADSPDPENPVLVPGAVFAISGDPRPGGDPADTYCVFDGVQADMPAKPAECDIYVADGNGDGVVTINPVEPGDYTVTEIVPPPGYMLTGDDSWSGTVDEQETQPVTFANRKIWLPLSATKTATGHFGAEYFWDVDKFVAPTADGPWSNGTSSGAPLVKNVASGDDTSLYYKVVVTEDHFTTSHYVVEGTIHVDNPNSAPVTATIDESLSGCTIDGAADPATVSVPAGGHTYGYTCDLGNGPVSAGTNHVTVSWDMNDYPQATDQLVPDTDPTHYTASASDGYTFDDESAVNKTVTVEDPFFGGGALMTVTYGVGGPSHESAVYSYDPDPTPGTCSATIQNTATLFGDDHVQITDDSEYGKVCVGSDLTAGMTDSESLTRTYPWAVEKSTSTPTVTVVNGAATATYDVTVTTGAGADSDWLVSGTITVTNPNDWDVPLTGLAVTYSGDNDANKADSCVVAESLAAAIPADGNRVFHYTCTFTSQPDYTGTVDAAITWDAAAAFTPHGSPTPPASTAVAEADWTLTEVDKSVTVHDDRASGQDVVIGTLDWATVYALSGHKTVIHYTVDLSNLPAAGNCANKVNTVWVVGHGGIHLDADQNAANNQATVQVCTAAVAVIVSPPEQQHPNVLPNTGGPDVGLLAAGLILLLGGGTLVASDRRRRRRS